MLLCMLRQAPEYSVERCPTFFTGPVCYDDFVESQQRKAAGGMRMAKKNEGRAVWFRMYRNIHNLVDAVPDESAGAALKAVFAYFDTGQLPENLDTLGYALFQTIKPAVDESNEDYEKAVERGRKAINKRWMTEDTDCIQGDTTCIHLDTE